MGIEQAVKRLGAPGQFNEVTLQRFGKGVEQRPGIASRKGIVSRFAPLVEHAREQFVRADTDIHCPDDKVVRGTVVDFVEPVRGETGVLMVPAVHQFPDRALYELRQVTVDVSRVFAGQLHLAGKAEIVADEDARASGNSGGEGFVVRIPQAEDPAIILGGFLAQDFHEPKISGTVVGHAVGLGADRQAVRLQRALDLRDEFEVWDGRPGRRGPRRRYELDFLAFDLLRSAMEAEVRAGAFGCGWCLVENSDHGGSPFYWAAVIFAAGLFTARRTAGNECSGDKYSWRLLRR